MESYMSLDKNFVATSTIGDYDVNWFDIRKKPFSIHGLYQPETTPFYQRMPLDVAQKVSENVDKLSRESTGGRVRFSTDSPYIAIRAKFLVVGYSASMSLVATTGFDLYVDGEYGSRFIQEFRMSRNITDSYEQIVQVYSSKMRSYTINFPLHAVVESLEIGLAPNAHLGEATPYRDLKPVVIYGSSIVHGIAASRPGNTYPAIMSRELNVDFVNMGFSASALGEEVMAEYLADLPMSVFVCDYDHNAPNPAHLEATHHRFYEIIREKNPDVPYIMVTRPNYLTLPNLNDFILSRRDVIMRSYLKARDKGDKNVYFIDGMGFNVSPHQYDMAFDPVHPNDSGFVRMADGIGTVVRHVLEKLSER